MDYDTILDSLRRSYDANADLREGPDVQPWKVSERQRLLELMRAEDRQRLLDVGAAAGVHGAWFADQGLQVVCTDLSPELVRRCQAKGLEAYVMPFQQLDFPDASFDAVFAMNVLLHVPRSELPATLASLRRVLKAGGLFYWGQYGGMEYEGTYDDDVYEPKRFFCRMTDEQIQEEAARFFDILDFRRIDIGAGDGFVYQSLTLRKADESFTRS